MNYEIYYNLDKNNIEVYTPKEIVYPLVPYIKSFEKKVGHKITIWTPFSKDYHSYPTVFREAGFKVITSHIESGQDFFKWKPSEEWDIIIDNPPFKRKKDTCMRIKKFNKPFCLLLPALWLNDSGGYDVFNDLGLQLLMPRKRVNFVNSNNRVPFKSIYYCYNVLDKQIEWFIMPK